MAVINIGETHVISARALVAENRFKWRRTFRKTVRLRENFVVCSFRRGPVQAVHQHKWKTRNKGRWGPCEWQKINSTAVNRWKKKKLFTFRYHCPSFLNTSDRLFLFVNYLLRSPGCAWHLVSGTRSRQKARPCFLQPTSTCIRSDTGRETRYFCFNICFTVDRIS